ncbi:helix-turn-helix domain-containing protein [Halobacillus massiliensis]|uniref:helix-turn-helix domain-containing protein n=1 Tax=Halobacillus massiliensis TaxID=1926286 RepID=UPI0015C4C827|nr:helix-turn-helix transcriptional regulator [Halobacillus massiliensis]
MKGQLIKQHRKYKKLTLEQLSKGICSPSYLSKIERNNFRASDEIYRLLSDKLNIKLDTFSEKFDKRIYDQLMQWHEAIKLKDLENAEYLYIKCQAELQANQNFELVGLYKVIHSRYILTTQKQPLPEDVLNQLHGNYSQSSYEYRFLYFKTVGIHYFITADYKQAITHLHSAEDLLEQFSLSDHELYFHLALTYTHLHMYVESNYYAEIALEGFQNSFNSPKVTQCYMLLGRNYSSLDVQSAAERIFLQLLRVPKNQLSLSERGKIYHHMGFIYYHQEKYEKAHDFLHKSLELNQTEKAANYFLLAKTSFWGNFGETSMWNYISLGEEEAVNTNSLKFEHKLFVLKQIILKKTDEESFIEKLEKEILPDFLRLDEFEDYKEHLELLGDIYYRKRHYKKAATFFMEANHYISLQKKNLRSKKKRSVQ